MNASLQFNARAPAPAHDKQTQSKIERVTQFAQEQHQRCKGQWMATYYDRLIKREGNAPALQPSWAINDRKNHMMRAANLLTDQRLARNLSRIDRAADRMAGRKQDGLGR